MRRDVAFVYCLVCHTPHVCSLKLEFKLVSFSQWASKSTPLWLLGWMKRSCLHGLLSTLRSSPQPTVTASTHPPDSSAQNAFSISSRALRELLRTPTVYNGLSRFYPVSELRRLFINSVHCATATLHVHRACPCQRQCPFLSAHFICSVSIASFANISLQASRTFRRSQRGRDMEVWAPIRRGITVIIASFRGVRRCQQKYTSRNYFCKLFLTSRYGRFMDFC